jgi:hypothetical protein
MAIAYGADVDGVRALLPHIRIADDTTPSQTDVSAYLEMSSNWVVMRLGNLMLFDEFDPGIRTRVEAHARGAVELRAAAQTEDAKYPERASTSDAGYAAVLRAQADRAIDEALEALGEGTGGGVGGPTGEARPIVADFPATPLVTRDQRF